jgi:hypothetical protein
MGNGIYYLGGRIRAGAAMSFTKYLIILGLGMGWCGQYCAMAGDSIVAGPVYANFPLTLAEGHRTEILGPLFYSEQNEGQHQWGIPPLGLSYTSNPGIQSEEFDFAYPLLTWDLYGREYRWQFFQLLNFAGGQEPGDSDTHRFTIFPVYFQQRSADPKLNYTAVVPFYGRLEHRLFRDEIDFVMLPFYVKSRKADVVTWNMPYPFFDVRRGNGLHGWQAWPFYGTEHKVVTTATNGFGDTQVVGGHDSYFVLWPFFSNSTNGIGTDNPSREQALLPFYDYYRSKLRDATSYLWPLGVTHTVDREKKFEEWDAPWPLIEFAHGEGKTERRVLPFFSIARNKYLEEIWYLWPVYRRNHVISAPLDYTRTRILFFLYSATTEKNTDTGRVLAHQTLLPFFDHRRDFNGNDRLQVLSIFEPFFPANKSVDRDYGPLFAIWRSEHSPGRGASSQSFFWNLYRRDTAPGTKKISLLFGLFQYQSSPDGTHWRVLYIPVGGAKSKAAPKAPPAG